MKCYELPSNSISKIIQVSLYRDVPVPEGRTQAVGRPLRVNPGSGGIAEIRPGLERGLAMIKLNLRRACLWAMSLWLPAARTM